MRVRTGSSKPVHQVSTGAAGASVWRLSIAALLWKSVRLVAGGPLYWGPTTHAERHIAQPRPTASAGARPVVRCGPDIGAGPATFIFVPLDPIFPALRSISR